MPWLGLDQAAVGHGGSRGRCGVAEKGGIRNVEQEAESPGRRVAGSLGDVQHPTVTAPPSSQPRSSAPQKYKSHSSRAGDQQRTTTPRGHNDTSPSPPKKKRSSKAVPTDPTTAHGHGTRHHPKTTSVEFLYTVRSLGRCWITCAFLVHLRPSATKSKQKGGGRSILCRPDTTWL